MAKKGNYIINDYGQLALVKEGGIASWTKVVAEEKTAPPLFQNSRAGILRGNEKTKNAFKSCKSDPDWKWRS